VLFSCDSLPADLSQHLASACKMTGNNLDYIFHNTHIVRVPTLYSNLFYCYIMLSESQYASTLLYGEGLLGGRGWSLTMIKGASWEF